MELPLNTTNQKGYTCPFCHYQRKADDDNPAWECPSCLKAYNKHQNNTGNWSPDNRVTIIDDDDEPTIGEKLGVMLATLFLCGILLRNLYTVIRYGYIEACSRGHCWLVYYYESPLEFIFQVVVTTFLFGYLCYCIYHHVKNE